MADLTRQLNMNIILVFVISHVDVSHLYSERVLYLSAPKTSIMSNIFLLVEELKYLHISVPVMVFFFFIPSSNNHMTI